MKKDLRMIAQNADLTGMNQWFLQAAAYTPMDEFEEEVKDVYTSIIGLPVEDKIVAVAMIQNDYSLTKTANELGVSVAAIFKRWKNIQVKIQQKVKEIRNERE